MSRAARRLRSSAWGAAFCSALLLCALACSRNPEAADPQQAKRVVLVTIDTLRADYVGSYGAERAATPTLDAIAANGVRFANAISPVPLTLPSHSTILTGRNPPQHGVRDNSIFVLPEEVVTVAQRFQEAGFATGAFVAAVVLDRRHGLARGFDRYGDEMGVRESGERTMHFPFRRATEVVDEALTWLDGAPDRFFLWVHLFDPHADYEPPPRYRVQFPDSPYAGEVAYADAEAGRLLAAVETRWPDRATLVVAASDHGENLGEHGAATHGYNIYDATQHVPLLFEGPRVPKGVVVPSVVRLADVAPTVLALMNLPPLSDTSGRDLSPLWSGASAAPRPAYVESLAANFHFGWSPVLGVRTEKYKYIRAPRPELYDLDADPGENHDIAEANPTLRQELDRTLDAELAGERAIHPTVAVTAGDRERLRGLGYVVANLPEGSPAFGRIAGADLKDKRQALDLFFAANAAMSRDEPAEALATLSGVDEHGPLFSFLRAEAHLSLEEYEEAETEVRRVLDAGTHHHAAWDLLARTLWRQGRTDEAMTAAETALEIDPGVASPRILLGRIYDERGDYAAAEQSYRDAVASRDGSLNARFHLIAFLFERGEEAQADALLADLPAEARPAPDALVRLVQAEAAIGREAAALRRLKRALAAEPGSKKIAFAYGSMVHRTRSSAEALVASEKVLSMDPESAAAQNNVAWMLLETGGDLDRALDLAERAARQEAGDPEYADTLASIRIGRGESEQALAAVDEGLPSAEGLTKSRLLYLRAQALETLGRREQARIELGRAFLLLDEIDDEVPPFWAADAAALGQQLDVTVPPAVKRVL